MAIGEQQVEQAVGKVFGELGVAITGPLIVLGDRLGLARSPRRGCLRRASRDSATFRWPISVTRSAHE